MDFPHLDPARTARSLFDEFKAFAFKGNVIDLAIGVIIGGAFGKIVSSLVANIILPIVGMLVPGQQSYKQWSFRYGGQSILYGQFLTDVVDFLIVAAALFFFVVKFLGWILKTRKQDAAAPPPAPTRQEALLIEIRDLLKQQSRDEPAPPSGSL